MCSVTLALTALTTGLQVAGQYQSSRAEAAAANAQAEAAYRNAEIQSKKGEQIAEQYAQQDKQIRDKQRLIAGQQRAEAGRAGVDSGVGSSLDVLMSTNDAALEDRVNLLTDQRYSIFDSNTAMKNYIAEGDAKKAQAKAAKTAGNIAMAGTILGAASQFAGMKTGGGSSTVSKTSSPNSVWVGSTPRSVFERTGMGYGYYYGGKP